MKFKVLLSTKEYREETIEANDKVTALAKALEEWDNTVTTLEETETLPQETYVWEVEEVSEKDE